jgi:hypothetical protein
MAVVGDRIQVPSKRVGQTPREGVVTGVSGALLRVTWSSGEESTIFPSMGSIVVVGRARTRAKKSTSKAAAPAKRPIKKTSKAPAKKTQKASTPKKSAKPGAKKTAKNATKKTVKKAAKKTAKKTANAKRAGAKKSSSRGPGRAGRRRK